MSNQITWQLVSKHNSTFIGISNNDNIFIVRYVDGWFECGIITAEEEIGSSSPFMFSAEKLDEAFKKCEVWEAENSIKDDDFNFATSDSKSAFNDILLYGYEEQKKKSIQ